MGICECCNNGKCQFNRNKDIQRNKKYEISDLCILESKTHDELKTNNNKEKDFNNKSFQRVIKNNGGIITKNNTQKNNNYKSIPCIDFGKDTISEIKSEKSYDIISQNSICNFIMIIISNKKITIFINYI